MIIAARIHSGVAAFGRVRLGACGRSIKSCCGDTANWFFSWE